MATGPAISVRGVSFTYDGTQRQILSDVSFDVPRGSVTAIMGGSGSGKTTLLRLIGGQVKPTNGYVHVLGQNLASLNQADLYAMRRQLGVLFQFGALFTDLSVFENVAFALREHTQLPEDMIRDLVLMKLHAVGLRGAADLMPSQISGGMARRVALARATALDPQLMLYDEPFAGLDPISLGITATLIKQFNDALGTTSVLVTHDVAETFAIADHVVLIAAGKVAASGSPAQLQASTDPLVRQFIDGAAHGPVAFHQPAPDYAKQMGVAP